MERERNQALESFIEAGRDKEKWIAAFRRVKPFTAMGPADIELTDINDEQAVLTMPVTDAVRQPFGLLHGGISMLMAETAASVHACWGIDLRRVMPVGVEINGSHLRGATEGEVQATAIVLRRSRSLVVHHVEIRQVESEKLICVARVTNFYKHLHGD